MKEDQIVNILSTLVNKTLSFLYSWLTNEKEVLAHILAIIHFIGVILIFILIVVSHTIYRDLWLKIVVIAIIFIIWCQHVFLKVCILISSEKQLIDYESPYSSIVNIFFEKSDEEDNYEGNITAETYALIFLALEIINLLL
jgi:hypothetical protein